MKFKLPPLPPYYAPRAVLQQYEDPDGDDDRLSWESAPPVDKYAKHKSSKKENYCTPAPFLERVTLLGPIGLDPCSNKHSLTCAKKEYRFEERGEDGLALPWHGFGLVYVNPPYGKKTKLWIRRMLEMARRGVEIVGLVAARPDTTWLQDSGARRICFWRGRMVFLDGDTGMPCADKNGKPTGAIFPQAVLYYGQQVKLFEEIFTYDPTLPAGQRGGKVVVWNE